jgi:hypothetical protein
MDAVVGSTAKPQSPFRDVWYEGVCGAASAADVTQQQQQQQLMWNSQGSTSVLVVMD